jgi:uncharacterized protein YndB with AHSA1/START domain
MIRSADAEALRIFFGRGIMVNNFSFNEKLDLVFERKTTLTCEQLWKAWTHPETLKQWFCPRPWRVTDCRIDLKAGGEFYNVMEGPGGEKVINNGCYLEVVENKKLVWTGMMTEGFRPVSADLNGFQFVATILFSKTPAGTLYQAIVAHSDEAGRKKHEQMGFQEGWGKAFDQLVALVKT